MMTIEEHYRALAPKLTNWLVASGSSYHDACDLVQRAFLKVWEMRADLRDDDSAVSGLLFTIARNLRKNMWRDDAKVTFVDEIHEEAAGAVQPAPSPSDADYVRERIQQAIAQLPPLLAEAYTLFQIGELSIREIAHETGVTENLVKVRIHRAKQKLQELLADLRREGRPCPSRRRSARPPRTALGGLGFLRADGVAGKRRRVATYSCSCLRRSARRGSSGGVPRRGAGRCGGVRRREGR